MKNQKQTPTTLRRPKLRRGYLLGARLNPCQTLVELHEVILYDRALNDSEIETLNRYLLRK